MGQGAGHVYGTERTRKRDGTRLVGDEGLDGSVGPVCGTGLRGRFLKVLPSPILLGASQICSLNNVDYKIRRKV